MRCRLRLTEPCLPAFAYESESALSTASADGFPEALAGSEQHKGRRKRALRSSHEAPCSALNSHAQVLYKAGQHAMAIQRYTMAANIAIQRPPWEMNGLMREELSTNLSNRSAAYFEAGDYLSALVDSEIVIQLRKPWSKGYFRKAKALMKMGQFQDAKDTVAAGLVYEPENVVRQRYEYSRLYLMPANDGTGNEYSTGQCRGAVERTTEFQDE